ncbi:MAG: ABC transporter permease [Chloroflexi bacterium]|nr:ABC transporter permease [Chloroflexota bacterium]
MLAYIARRLLWLPVVLFAVSFITFTLGFYGPGDPAQVRLGARATPEQVERLRRQLGLDRPFLVQYGDYVWHTMRGDLGESITKFPGQRVGTLVARRIWVSAQLGLAALILAVVLGIALGQLAAMHQGSWLDSAIISLSLFFGSVPVFVSAPFLLLFLVAKLGLLPASGWGGLFDQRIIIPALALGTPGIAAIARLTRASTLDVLGQDYVRTARAKGLPEGIVRRRYILRNALVPLVTVIGLSLGGLVEGGVISETIFGIPGIGQLALSAITSRDYPIIMALGLIIAVAFIVANLLVDVAYAFVDPRIRYQ